MIQDPEIEYKSRGYDVEVRNLATGRSAEIILYARGERWIVKAEKFHGVYSSLEHAVDEALKIIGKVFK